jgi:hypothetical protein
MIASRELSVEIFEYLRTKLEIPNNVSQFSLHIGRDEIMRVECTYYPEAKDGNGEHNAQG